MAAFHWARRDLVLLRDILRLGTATSALLRNRGTGGPGILSGLVSRKQILQHGPDTSVTWVPVVRLGIGQPDPARAAKPLAADITQRRQRQLKHEGIPQRGLKVEQVTIEQVPIIAGPVRRVRLAPATHAGEEQLLEPHLRARSELIEAPCALASQRCRHLGGDQNPFANFLKLNIKLKPRALRHPHQARAEFGWRGDHALLAAR